MNFPFQFGLPQFLLLIVAIIGLALFFYAAHSLLRGEKRYKHLTDEEKEIYYRHGRLPRRRRLRWQHGIGGLLLVVFSLSLLWLTFLIQSYLGLTSDIKVAQVTALAIDNNANGVPMMSVDLTLYDQNGKATSQHSYLVMGNEWMLQDDTVKINGFLNILGVHSGYKITRLEGRFDDPNLEANSRHTVVTLNGGDDGFFQNMKAWHGWVSPFVDAQYGTAVFSAADGTYNIFASQTGLYDEKVNT